MTFSFGSSTGNATSGFTGFGNAAKTTASNMFGSGFGATTSSSGFGNTTAVTPFNFGGTTAATTTSSLFSGFGAKTTASSTGFSGFGSGFGGFGATTTSAPSAFGGGGTGTLGGGGLFGGSGTGTLGGGGLFTGFGTNPTWTSGQTQQPQQQQQAAVVENPLAAMTSAVTMPTLFGDERDSVIAKLNQLQALWGYGKAFFSINAQPINFTLENPFCRFKTIGYSCLPSAKDSDGFVSLDLKHKEDYVKQNQTQLVDSIHKILGSQTTLSVCVESVRSLPGDKSEVIIFVVERQSNGASRRILATELYAVFSQDNLKKQLEALGVENMVAKTALNESQLKQFLDNPPLGVDLILWEQAKKDNPDPKRLIPVPMMGFDELRKRLDHQKYQNIQHQKRLDLISDEISKLQTAHSTTVAKLAQYKRKHLELGHRTLEVMIYQETVRKMGFAIEPEEEHLRIQLESLQAELNSPMQFKGRLNELMSQTRLQSQINSSQNSAGYVLDDQTKAEIKLHLAQQQNGLLNLISIIKDDFEDLKIIENGILDAYIPRR
uniref:Nucleoporin p54 n=1 Tax=Hydra vulgaris TaxID=6087 RepID=T2MAU9_HYDVU